MCPNSLRRRIPYRRHRGAALVVPLAALALAGLASPPAGPPHPALGAGLAQYQPAELELVEQLGGTLDSLAVAGGHAFLEIGQRIVVVDVSEPDRPRLVGRTARDYWRILAVHRDHLYAVAGAEALAVLDVSDPAAPTEVGRVTVTGVGWARDMVHLRDELFVLPAAGLYVLDLAAPDDPQVAAHYTDANGDWVATRLGRYVYTTVSAPAQGRYVPPLAFVVLDFADLAAPTAVGQTTVSGMATADRPAGILGMAVAGEHVLAASNAHDGAGPAGLKVFDVSDPTAPRELASLGLQCGHTRAS